ncbi:MAG: right-handed parallel beta-helix repeat-containing protein [Cyanomargarita calcarea GSE-NOS-MK-12-04C]|jgi:hypothetical protein|uniref:Right-handed parallel beta-helix repeat-containing protein n=1 Tax=Cyanomargarita calcarea GSE-NOS-MK-12-04C TaxID=2839659 RepID=A0A951UQ99_9CYAN|nr:right-handed parallel beta-helix repeat-containing protein [Cyanomargarita calcarea GSE-NOS-MK-12-04C]
MKFTQLAYMTVLWVVAIASSVVAQTTVSPRFEIRYTTEGAGFDSLGSVEGFVPLFQTPGSNVTFFQGRAFVDNDSHMGGNLLLGHRTYNRESDRIVGTYISYDIRDTDKSYFTQLGLGIESLGNWDFRANAYLPLGNTSEQAAPSIYTNPVFSGSNLNLNRSRLYQVSLSGVDAEVGTRLASLGAGDLRGYAGLYYLSGGESREAFGWKTRLEANPTNFLGMSLSLQNDALYDTRAVFSIGLSFPSSGATRTAGKPSNWGRMAGTIDRLPAILVANETRQDTVLATNPATGQPWRFIHVTGVGNSDGTFESPYAYSEIAKATGAARIGDIIYVRSGGSTSIPSFNIPSGVQVLSNIPEQRIDAVELSNIKLPFSGTTGVLPTVGGTVTLASNTTLSGFNINGASGAGVRGTNVSNVTIRDNRIQNSITNPANLTNLGEGIFLTQATGKVNILNNIINQNANTGILINNNAGSTDLTLANNQIADNFNSIRVNLNGTATGTAQITSNQITNSGTGIDVNLSEKAQLTNLTINKNTITAPTGGTLDQGVNVTAFDNAKATVAIADNTIRKATTEGIGLFLNQNSDTKINVAGNTIENVQGDSFSDGIDLQLFDNAKSDVNISGNTINNVTGRGISASSFNDTTSNNLNIVGNKVSNTTFEGIGLDDVGGSATINNNTITNIGNYGLFFTGLGKLNSTIIGNTIDGTVGAGIQGINISNTTIQNNTIKNAITGNPEKLGEGIFLTQATGKLNISNNTINKNANTGILINNNAGSTDLTLANNQIADNFNSIRVNLNGTATGTAQITSNQINNSGTGIDVNLSEKAQLTNLTINKNNINAPTGGTLNQGINVVALDDAKATVTVADNTIRNSISDGIKFSLNQNSVTQINVTGNTIEKVQGSIFSDGIDFEIFDNANAVIKISDNKVSDTTGLGLYIGALGSSQTFTTINSNTFTASSVEIAAYDSARICSAINSNNKTSFTLVPNDATVTYQVVDAATLSTRNNGATITNSGSGSVANVSAATCPRLP